jgi:hypothetical protein
VQQFKQKRLHCLVSKDMSLLAICAANSAAVQALQPGLWARPEFHNLQAARNPTLLLFWQMTWVMTT